MRFPKNTILILLAFAALLNVSGAQAAQKISGGDDRIKTLVYEPSEVYRIITRAGFQTTLEFNNDETIDTISIGDSIGWQLTPAGKRLFLKPIHKSGITNLSVITNKRSYQFELVATSSTSLNSTNSYVVKFYYPENGGYPEVTPLDMTRGQLRPINVTPIPQFQKPEPAPMPAINAPLPGEAAGYSPIQAALPQNYNYTMSGPDSIAPVKIYDDGKSTYFQFPPNVKNPQIFVVSTDGNEFQLTPHPAANGLVAVDSIAPKMAIRQGRDTVFVFNENKALGY